MIRIACIADSHFGRGSRWEETLRIHRWIAQDLAERRPNVIVHTGDVFEGPRSTPEERAAVADWVESFADVAPMLIVRGNHDPIGDLPLFARMRTHNPVDVCETVGVYRYGVGDRSREISIAAMAWPRKAHLHALMQRDAGQEETAAIGQELLCNVLRGLGGQLEQHQGPRIFAGHVMVRGSRTSVGQPLVGCDHELGIEDLSLASCDAYLLGHIHMPQEWDALGAPVIYPGSPRRTSFGEVEEKGYVMLEVDPETRRVTWERIATPCAPMLLISADLGDVDCPETGATLRGLTVSHNPSDEQIRGAEIRLRYQTPADERETAAREAECWAGGWLGRGAASVKVEEQVLATMRARAPEITTAQSLVAKCGVIWERDGLGIGRQRQLAARLAVVEEEVRGAA